MGKGINTNPICPVGHLCLRRERKCRFAVWMCIEVLPFLREGFRMGFY